MTPRFDASPLTAPVDPRTVREHTRRLRAEGRLPGGTVSTIIGSVVAVAVAVVFLLVFVSIFGSFVAMLAGGRAGWVGLIPLILIVGIGTLGTIFVVRGLRGAGARRYRLDAFARSNGMTYVPSIPSPHLPGMIFGQGSSRQATDLVRGDLPRFVEFGNYRYTTGSGKNRTTHRWGYVAVKLDVLLPHIVLDALSNNGLFGASNLPALFGKDQRLSLEGDFDRYFSLYCPADYERDALYLFTPDIMARFIDNAAALDVEIVDDWMFLYAKRDLSTLDPATWAWLFSVVAALLDKFAQWARWRDERLAAPPVASMADAVGSGIPGATAGPAPMLTPPPAGVAAGGRRLRRRTSWIVFVLLGGVVLWWIVAQTGVFATMLGSLLGR